MKYLLPILIFFTACNATKQSATHFKKGIKKDRVYFAKATRDSFPCTELFRTDTAFVYTDSTIYIDCPDYSDVRFDTVRFAIDTLKGTNSKAKTVYIPQRVQVKIPVRTQIINRYWEDSAKIVLAKNDLTKTVNLLNEWKGKAQKRGTANAWFIAAIALLIAALVLAIRTKNARKLG